MRYSSIIDVLVIKSNISIDVPAFWCQLLQNTAFILLVTKLALATIKQKMDVVIKNPYFKFLANNIIFSMFEKFFFREN